MLIVTVVLSATAGGALSIIIRFSSADVQSHKPNISYQGDSLFIGIIVSDFVFKMQKYIFTAEYAIVRVLKVQKNTNFVRLLINIQYY